MEKRVPSYASLTTSSTAIVVDGITYVKPRVVSSNNIEYRSEETIDELIALITKAKNATSANEAQLLTELNAFLNQLPELMEIIDIS